jgi:ABC-type methionine transport system ATPase subunit
MSLLWKILVCDEGTESVDIATNENILLLDEYSEVKLF